MGQNRLIMNSMPPLAIRTQFSPLEGAASPADWAGLVQTLPRVLLADRDDLTGLPAALEAWGRQRVVPGATVRLGSDHPEGDVLLVARTPAAYAGLCRYLSARHHGTAALHHLAGVTVLLREAALVPALAAVGAEVHWWCHDRPDVPPAGLPAVALPVLTARHGQDRAGDAVRQAIARREGRVMGTGWSWDDLPTWMAAFQGHPALVDAGLALLAEAEPLAPPVWHMPPSLHAEADAALRARAEAGMVRRYARPGTVRVPDAVRQRLDHELAVIATKGFAGYLLTVADLAEGRRTCGRGSGASSLVVYCLGVTNVDPVRYHLLFERFLNPARTDPPDLDVDFPWDERDAVLAAALRTYGADRVAMVANHLHLRRWSALRIVARAYGQDEAAITAVRRQIRAHERYGTALSLAEPWPGILIQARHLEGVPHHLGLHCGGVVITAEPLHDLVPIHPAAKRIDLQDEDGDDEAPPLRVPIPAIAWEKDGAEAMGLVKIDLLGNRSLAVVRDTLADLAEDGITIDETRWRPADDLATRDLVAAGDTLGCFYIESPAMRQLQAKAASGDFDRLVVHSSIIRPAASRWIATYLERLHHWRRTGRHEDAWYPHPALRGLLSESFGVLSYQEDVMLAAMHIAGFDDRQANALRKALGHWDSQERLTRFAGDFRAGALARGTTPEVIDVVWGNIASFAGYSFCKAHSASYAMVSFQCAWLKAHHPAHFLARVVANEGGFYGPGVYLEEARRRGIRLLPPCVVASEDRTVRAAADAIRVGLHLVPGLSAPRRARLLAERVRRPFAGLADLALRVGLDAGTLDTLARIGALDALAPGRHRAQVTWMATAVGLAAQPRRVAEAVDDGQLRWLPPAVLGDPEPPALPPLTARAAAWAQFRTLGFCPDGHPIWFVKAARPARRCADVTAAREAGRRMTVVAWPVTRKQVEAHGPSQAQPMAFVTLEDETGLMETVWFPEVYAACGPALEAGLPLRCTGVIGLDHSVATLEVQAAEPVDIGPAPQPAHRARAA